MVAARVAGTNLKGLQLEQRLFLPWAHVGKKLATRPCGTSTGIVQQQDIYCCGLHDNQDENVAALPDVPVYELRAQAEARAASCALGCGSSPGHDCGSVSPGSFHVRLQRSVMRTTNRNLNHSKSPFPKSSSYSIPVNSRGLLTAYKPGSWRDKPFRLRLRRRRLRLRCRSRLRLRCRSRLSYYIPL